MEAFIRKTDAIRKLQLLVSRGNYLWTAGQVPAIKFEALALKFTDRYHLDLTPAQRVYRRRTGQAVAYLVAWQESRSQVCWWLLATPGEGLITELENLRDARSKPGRIEVDGYELLQAPIKGRKTTWTWRNTRANYSSWQERITTAIRSHNDFNLRQALYSLRRTPGFAALRREALLLFRFAQAEWKRFRRGDWPHGEIFLGWLGKYRTGETRSAKEISEEARRKARRRRAHVAPSPATRVHQEGTGEQENKTISKSKDDE
jgi:hypothetical protein